MAAPMKRAALLAVAVVLIAAALWQVTLRGRGDGGRVAAGDTLDDLMMDLDIVPLDPRPAQAFALASLDGARVALGDVAGRAALLYFWASW
jgi:hypothetical protein